MRKIVMIAGLLSMSFILPGFCEDREIGQYTSVEGRVDVVRAGEDKKAERLRADSPVFAGDILRTKSNSKVEVTFRDNSVLRLAPDSRVAIEEYIFDGDSNREKAVVRLYRGKMRAIVSKNGGDSNFHILTPSARGTVKGTDIFAVYQADNTGIFVKDGKIAVSNNEYPDQVRDILKGNFVNIPAGGLPGESRAYFEAELSLYEKETEPVFSEKDLLRGKGTKKLKGEISFLTGDVRLFQGKDTAPRQAMLRDILGEGDKVETGGDGRVKITLENGNIISLKPDSEIEITRLRLNKYTGEYENMFKSDYGKIKSIVEKLGEKSTFKIKTPSAVCGVRGTVMYLDIAKTGTKAFYEGGGGYLRNIISGLARELSVGQNASSDISGNITQPADTTAMERLFLEEAWEGTVSVDSYSDQGNRLPGAALTPVGGDTRKETLIMILEALAAEDPNGKVFDEVPFQQPEVTALPPAEGASFAPAFGYIGPGPGGSIDFMTDRANPGDGMVFFNVPGAGGVWAGLSLAGNHLEGLFDEAGSGEYKLWGADFEYTATDGGKMIGRVGGNIVEGRIAGKLFGIYVDNAGYAGTFNSSLFRGREAEQFFISEGPAAILFNSRGISGVTPDQFMSESLNEGKLYSAAGAGGEGYFQGESGVIYCDRLGGETISLQGADTWGVCDILMTGSHVYGEGGTGAWVLPVGGYEENGEGSGANAWIVTVNGDEWSGGSMSGTFHGLWLSEGEIPGSVRGGSIFNGDAAGAYNDSEFTWQAVGAAEWVEITELLSEMNMGFSVSEFQNFVSVPITEAFSSVVNGQNCTMNAVMDIHLYQNGLDNIWAGFHQGTYSGTPAESWALSMGNNDGHMITLTGDQWSDGQWHATVSGVMPAEGINLSGEAAGVYANGLFEGVSAGTWTDGEGRVTAE
ncbi:MAG: FecR family protein [Candidatus Omnitrophota bacterium]